MFLIQVYRIEAVVWRSQSDRGAYASGKYRRIFQPDPNYGALPCQDSAFTATIKGHLFSAHGSYSDLHLASFHSSASKLLRRRTLSAEGPIGMKQQSRTEKNMKVNQQGPESHDFTILCLEEDR